MSGARQRQKRDRIERELGERHEAIDDDRLVACHQINHTVPRIRGLYRRSTTLCQAHGQTPFDGPKDHRTTIPARSGIAGRTIPAKQMTQENTNE